MEPRWLATPTFATLASVSRKCAHAALSKAFERQMAWRGHHLTVRQVSGRGGAAGRRYEVLLSSCPADIQAAYAERFGLPGTAALPVPIEPTAALPAIIPCNPEKEDRDLRRARWLEALFRPAIREPKGSPARALAINELITREQIDPDGKVVTLSRGRVYAVLQRYEAEGFAAFFRRPRSDRGKRQVIVSTKFDALIRACGRDDAYLVDLWAKIQRRVRSEWACGAGSWPNVQFNVMPFLMDLAREAGCTLPDAAARESCWLPKHVICAERRYRRLHQYRNDRGGWAAEMEPRLSRLRSHLSPMEWIAGDVFHCDIAFRRDDGSMATPKCVLWVDLRTNRAFGHFFLMPVGKMIRTEHVAYSFTMLCVEQGVPCHIYVDNGGEYRWIDMANDLTRLAARVAVMKLLLRDQSELAQSDDDAEPGVHRSRAYNPQSKVIESIIAAIKRTFEQQMPGYIGGNRLMTKREHQGKPPKPFPSTFDRFVEIAQLGLDYYNSKRQQSGHIAGMSPNEAFTAFCAEHTEWQPVTLDPSQIGVAFAKEHGPLTIHTGGELRRENIWYICPALAMRVGEKATVRQPIFGNRNVLYCWDERGNYAGVAQPKTDHLLGNRSGAVEQSQRSKALQQTRRLMESDTENLDRADVLTAAVRAAGGVPTATPGNVISVFDPAVRDAEPLDLLESGPLEKNAATLRRFSEAMARMGKARGKIA